ncbi:hypothetical protein BURPS1710A_0369 [Burkholderia pseudomallei 1710a]|uniref:Uncharacterized protein n=1 Tax=Burkholderia pseudomallei 1710a TaxID=320371 RepID=A0A0E1W4E8_BURPE|nr:hypothetical protein BURPS1710A_0369 [Burkholderia pseudomallei 1710a]
MIRRNAEASRNVRTDVASLKVFSVTPTTIELFDDLRVLRFREPRRLSRFDGLLPFQLCLLLPFSLFRFEQRQMRARHFVFFRTLGNLLMQRVDSFQQR